MNAPDPAQNAPAAEPRSGVSLINVMIVAIACSAISGYASWRLATSSRASSPVVIVDTEKIAKAQIDQTLSKPGITQEQAAAAGQQFIRALNAELIRYSDAGVVVLNASVALNRPAGVDATREIAAALGVDLK
ncbi:TrbI F-type domain-containing protein [Methylibium petroleiphilum]|uniref:Uncharacterized protein n=1 Tax=Methylibium petroleiphilum (strain ATCC BAA-1232 / LMG 22953 / PM1) TaxID=420662 RepID=A2SNK8_METPP|nr:TrbI F-type domain-containing protein [Methylibium petroleiphilum]ABM97147.1 hypothetical protein Mpe_B0372 [Methylibium petroleiphilum PM1]